MKGILKHKKIPSFRGVLLHDICERLVNDPTTHLKSERPENFSNRRHGSVTRGTLFARWVRYGLCALCFLVVEVIVRRGGGSAPNSKNKRTIERGIKLVRLLFQRTSRRKSGKYCLLTVVSLLTQFKVIWGRDSYVFRSCLLDSHARVSKSIPPLCILSAYDIRSFLVVVTWVLWVPAASFTVNIWPTRHVSGQ